MLIDSINDQAKRIVGNVEGRDEIEFTMDIAAELPMQAICEMIGIAPEDRHRPAGGDSDRSPPWPSAVSVR